MHNRFDRVVVLGAGGMVGRRVVAGLEARRIAAQSFRHADLDLGEFDTLQRRLSDARPTLVFNCAAFTKVDDCESQPQLAMRINGDAVGAMSDVARQIGALVVHISSDYVFPGDGTRPYREDDPTGAPGQLGAYGRSKLEGERQLLASGCSHLLVRTSWVFGAGGPNFVDTIRKAAAARPELKVVNDQRGRPTYAPDLADAMIRLVEHGDEGIFHVANAEACTWYDFACEIVRQYGLTTPVHPCTTAEYPRPAKRPAYSVLDTGRFDRTLGRPLRAWSAALSEYLSSQATA